MNEFFVRSLIWGVSSIFLGSIFSEEPLTIFILAGFVISCSCCYFEHCFFNAALSIWGFIATLFFPTLGVFLPILAFQFFFQKDRFFWAELELSAITEIFFLYHLLPYGFLPVLMNLLFLLCSSELGGLYRNLLLSKEAFIKLRDDNTEKQQLLVERNKMLIEKQNDELHLATLSERNRIAREIHDNVGHTLSRSILQLGALLAINKGTPVEAQLLPLKETLDEAMNNIRTSVHDLHNTSFNLKGALQNLLDEMKDYRIQFTYNWDDTASTDLSYCFLSIIKEAFTNIRKHSNGDMVTLSIQELSNYYQLMIQDNGTNHDIKTGHTNGIGLKNMEDRVRNFHGMIYFNSEFGFRIFVSIPKNNTERTDER